jgi:hypothetical protein
MLIDISSSLMFFSTMQGNLQTDSTFGMATCLEYGRRSLAQFDFKVTQNKINHKTHDSCCYITQGTVSEISRDPFQRVRYCTERGIDGTGSLPGRLCSNIAALLLSSQFSTISVGLISGHVVPKFAKFSVEFANY